MAKEKQAEEPQMDHVIENIENIESTVDSFFMKYSKQLVIALVVLLLVIFGLLYYFMAYRGPHNQEAAEAMFKAEQSFQADSFKVALEGNGTDMGFLDIIDEYKFTDAGKSAKMYAGLCYKKMGENEKAIEYLKAYSTSAETVEPSIEGAIGDCYLDLGKNDEAISYYQKAIKSENKLVSPIYMQRLGLVYIKSKDKDNAVKTFQDLKDNYPNSMEAQEADKYIEYAKAL